MYRYICVYVHIHTQSILLFSVFQSCFAFCPFQKVYLEMDFQKFSLITSVLKSEMIPLF